MDAFSQRALLTGSLALREAGASREGPERTGLVVASAHGPLTTMFRYLDQVLDKGDGRGSPVLFASSLHNAPAAYLSLLLGMRGPSLTVTGFHHAFARALGAALDWLARDAVARVVLIADDEFHPVLGYGLRGLGRCAPDGRMRPLAFDRASWVPGETCVAFVLERPGDEPSRWGRLGSPVPFRGPLPLAATAGAGAPVFLAARGDPDEGRGYAAALPIAAPVAAYSPLWGANPTSEAMTLAVAAVTLAERRLFPVPDADGLPDGLHVAEPGPLAAAAAVHCCAMDDRGNGVVIEVGRG
jgi:3-oxoacyl-[acyl-carrier-protein] synthase II